MNATSVGTTTKRSNDRRYIALPPELHDGLKALAARDDRTIVDTVKRLLRAAEALR